MGPPRGSGWRPPRGCGGTAQPCDDGGQPPAESRSSLSAARRTALSAAPRQTGAKRTRRLRPPARVGRHHGPPAGHHRLLGAVWLAELELQRLLHYPPARTDSSDLGPTHPHTDRDVLPTFCEPCRPPAGPTLLVTALA